MLTFGDARTLIAALLGLLPLMPACSMPSSGGPPWSLEGVPLPNDENSIQRTIHHMSILSTKYDLTFLPGDRDPPSLFAFRPLGLDAYRVDTDGHLGVGRESSEWGDEWTIAGVALPMHPHGGLPGNAALGFLRDFIERLQAGGGRVDAENLEPDDEVVWVATDVAGVHGFVWGTPASPWVFEVEADTKRNVANLVRAFAEAARAANRDRAFSRSANLAGSTLLVTSDTRLREDYAGSVEVEADDVILDCGGHTIFGPGTRAEDEYGFIGILLDGRSGVTVKNCRISGFDYGILLTARLGTGSDGNRVIDNAVSGNRLDGIRVNESEHNVLSGNTAFSNGQHGITLAGDSNSVSRNRAIRNGASGFAIGAGYRDNAFYGNTSTGNRYHGFQGVGTGDRLVRNTAANNGLSGFAISGSSILVRKNRAVRNRVQGFSLSQRSRHNTFDGNMSIGNGDHGFLILGTEHMIAHNKASENGLIGFAVGEFGKGASTFVGNSAIGNKIHGFQIAGSRGNTFIRNTASANRAVGFAVELGALENALFRNIARYNGGDGFRTMQDSIRNRFEMNGAFHNGWIGFRAESGPNLFSNNRACNNGEMDASDVGTGSTWRDNAFCFVGNS